MNSIPCPTPRASCQLQLADIGEGTTVIVRTGRDKDSGKFKSHQHRVSITFKAEAESGWKHWLEAEKKDLVWGAPFYTKTGIKPYVLRAGARVPSLRRVQQKHHYFTNGSSRSLRHLLSRFRYKGLTAWHHYEPQWDQAEASEVKALTPDEIDALEELLRFF